MSSHTAYNPIIRRGKRNRLVSQENRQKTLEPTDTQTVSTSFELNMYPLYPLYPPPSPDYALQKGPSASPGDRLVPMVKVSPILLWDYLLITPCRPIVDTISHNLYQQAANSQKVRTLTIRYYWDKQLGGKMICQLHSSSSHPHDIHTNKFLKISRTI